jgi:hypothetical protein
MISLVRESAAGQPARWVLAFQRRTESRIVDWLAWGTYKHVSAFGHIAEVDHWLFLDWRFSTVDVIVARGQAATQLLDYYTRDADLLGMAPRKVNRGVRLGLWCVPAIKHLVGIEGGALRPDALWRDCIRQGAEILSHEDTRTDDAADRPHAAATG